MAGLLFDLTDRVAVVSGAARGMSCPMAIGFAEYGADLLLADVDAARMEDPAATIEALGRKAVPACAPSRPEQIDALYDTLDGSSLASTSRVTWRGALRDRIEVDPVLRSLPTSRLGQAEEINGLAILLASDASSLMSGALVPLDGGNLAKNAGGSHPGMPPLGPS